MAGSVSTEMKLETTITAMMYVRRSAAAVDFYTQAFGAATLMRLENDDGSVIAHMAIGKGDIWVAEESPDHQNFSPESVGGNSMHPVLIVDDPHAVFQQAIAAGATSICPVRDEEYGWRIGRLVDPFGHHWEIGRPLSEG
jgi:PhnB protein